MARDGTLTELDQNDARVGKKKSIFCEPLCEEIKRCEFVFSKFSVHHLTGSEPIFLYLFWGVLKRTT